MSQVTVYGATVSSAPRLEPSSLNWTPATPTLSDAFAPTDTVPETTAPAAGAVTATAGFVVSEAGGAGAEIGVHVVLDLGLSPSLVGDPHLVDDTVRPVGVAAVLADGQRREVAQWGERLEGRRVESAVDVQLQLSPVQTQARWYSVPEARVVDD